MTCAVLLQPLIKTAPPPHPCEPVSSQRACIDDTVVNVKHLKRRAIKTKPHYCFYNFRGENLSLWSCLK